MVGFSLSHSIYWEVFSQWFLNLSHVDNQTRLCLSHRQYFSIKQNHESQVEGAKVFRGECYSENRFDLGIKPRASPKHVWSFREPVFFDLVILGKHQAKTSFWQMCLDPKRSWAKLILTCVRRQLRSWVMRFRWGFLVKGKGSELLGLNKKQHPGGGFIFF